MSSVSENWIPRVARWRLAAAGAGVWLVVAVAAGSAQEIPEAWLKKPPGAAEAEQIERGAERYGWPAMAKALRRAATGLYARRQMPAAEGWYYAARWAEAWGETEAAFERRWREAMEAEGAWYREDEAGREAGERVLGEAVSPALRRALLADGELSATYFELEQAVDRRPRVWAILEKLRAADAKTFDEYEALALAVALVYDVPPPPDWPHHQVGRDVLPRRLPAPEEAFAFLVETDRGGRSLHRLRGLGAAELRFAVDLAAPFEELRWAQAKVKPPLGRLAETYSGIEYSQGRIIDGVYDWPGTSYTLADIAQQGGICVDQAYFATQAGKARGVPTLLFRGAGLDGRHAWFGYLDGGRRWQLDAGRYEEQKYVTGLAHDPQTWTDISDHELAFLSEGFRRRENYRVSRLHGWFARWLKEDGRAAEAETAVRTALGLERRNLEAWGLWLEATPEPGPEREGRLREAALAWQAYPELQAGYLGELAASLRARGEDAAAETEERALARRYQTKRGDLSLKQIAEQLARAAETQPLEQQTRLYRTLLREFGRVVFKFSL